jgi:GxxExxY protein
MDIEGIASIIIDSAIQIHRTFGPGLLESAHQKCLIHKLKKGGLDIKADLVRPIIYDGEVIGTGYRIDTFVNDCVIIDE